MDEDRADLIQQLLTRMGMVLEDASADAITATPTQNEFVITIDRLGSDLATASALLTAAKVLFAAGPGLEQDQTVEATPEDRRSGR